MTSRKDKSPPRPPSVKPFYYVLDAHGNPVAEPDFTKWAEWVATNDCTVAYDIAGAAIVSTRFVGIDPGAVLNDGSPPALWETVVFNSNSPELHQRRTYSSREDAVAGHRRVLIIGLALLDFP
jgi:hypothetical protein